MISTANAIPKKTFLFYQPDDFILYVFALAIVQAGFCLAFPNGWIRGLAAMGLLYLAVTFILKRGAKLDFTCLSAVSSGLAAYPRRLVRLIRTGGRLIPVFSGILLVGLAVEHAGLTSPSIRKSFLAQPFPYLTAFAIHFTLISAFRTVICITQLRRTTLLGSILGESGWRHELKRLAVWNHVLHGYVTGLLTHVCLFIPSLIFWRFTQPTFLRELAMFTMTALVIVWVGPRRCQKILYVTRCAAFLMAHEEDHKSRFHFAVLHGPHHDAIPTAVMAASETGFCEAIDRGIHLWLFTYSVLALVLLLSLAVPVNMLGHQYVPGVFPFSGLVMRQATHHVAHHFGSLRPLGFASGAALKSDLDAGYNPQNGIMRWYLAAVRQHEDYDENLYAHFDGDGA